MKNQGLLLALLVTGGLVFFFGYMMVLNTSVAKPQIQACYDAGGEPYISNLNEFIACQGRNIVKPHSEHCVPTKDLAGHPIEGIWWCE